MNFGTGYPHRLMQKGLIYFRTPVQFGRILSHQTPPHSGYSPSAFGVTVFWQQTSSHPDKKTAAIALISIGVVD
jgi:hypothetical protein